MPTPSPSRVASMFLLARSGIEMDLYARARTLEAAADLPKWSLSRSPRTFLSEGPTRFPDVDEEWFSRRDTGFADKVLEGARSVLRAETGEATAEEVAQNMAAGLSIGGSTKLDVYGELGQRHGGAILSGRKSPKSLGLTLFGYAKGRALDVWRKKMRNKKVREESNPHLVGPTSLRETPANVALDRSPQEVMLSLISGPGGQKFRNWVYQTIQRKGTEVQKIIIEASLDHLRARGEWPSANTIRDKVIEMKGSGISVRKINDHRKKVEQLLAREMKADPKVTDWIDRYLDLAALGYGGGQLRAAKVAERHLARGHQLTDDESSDLGLANWQKDIGAVAANALKRFPGVQSVARWGTNRDDAVVINFTRAPGPTPWSEMDRYDRMDSAEIAEMRIIDHVKKTLRPLLGVGRSHEEWSGFYTTEDYLFASSKDGVKWTLEIHPHQGR